MHLLLMIFLAIGGNANNCEVCHSNVKVEFQRSVHAQEGFTCVSCHGGNPESEKVQSAHQGEFSDFNDRKEISKRCASCHSDSTKMKPYGLPTDQLALYETSIHGKALAKGDTKVAICTDCHGTHKILPPSDPESLTHPRNIASTCGRCHGDPDIMGAYGLPSNVVSDFESGVHGQALEAGNLQVPVCTNCHGTHGAAPPGIGDISIVCGHCHAAERQAFRFSPHNEAMQESGIAECASCHNHHKIQIPERTFWTTGCQECHEAGSPASKRGEEIGVLLTQADEEIQNADREIKEAIRIPLTVSDYEAGLEEARTYLLRAGPRSHSLDVQDIGDLTRSARSIALEIQSEILGARQVFRGRKIVLIVVLFLIVLTISVIYRFRVALESKPATLPDKETEAGQNTPPEDQA